jgi:tetratricopeptide (TPR) repeat protein
MKVLLLSLSALTTSALLAQTTFPSLSPKCRLEQKVGFTTIVIDYERPSARGRKIFGELVPYNKLWRTGAGHCTKMGFTTSVTIGNKKMEKGIYSLFTIPTKKEWTIIINRDTTLYGIRGYDERNDVVRIKVSPQSTHRHYEALTLEIDLIPNNARIYISWAQTQISFDIETETDKTVNEFIQLNLLNDLSKNAEEYALGAEYYYYLNKNSALALNLINKAIAKKNESWYYRQKIDILEQLKRYSEAIDCANKAISIDRTRSNWDMTTKQQSIDLYSERINILKSKSRKIINE